jgi:DNA repair protein RadC
MDNKLAEITVSYKPNTEDSPVVGSATGAVLVLRELFNSDTLELREEAICLYLNRANHLLGWYRISSGGITGTVIDIRLILSVALKTAASALVLAHNHPSGNLVPSLQDREVTQKLKEASRLMDIQLLDHLILSKVGYYSFADDGLI